MQICSEDADIKGSTEYDALLRQRKNSDWSKRNLLLGIFYYIITTHGITLSKTPFRKRSQ